MLDWLFSASAPTLLMISSITLLSAAWTIGRLSARFPAAALRGVLMCGVLALVLPVLFVSVRSTGWGLLRPVDVQNGVDQRGAPDGWLGTHMHDDQVALADSADVARLPSPLQSDRSIERVLSGQRVSEERNASQTESVSARADAATRIASDQGIAMRKTSDLTDDEPLTAAILGSRVRANWQAVRDGAVLLWICASVALALRLVVGFARSRGLASGARYVADENRLAQLRRAARRLGVKRVDLRHTNDVRSPVVWCWNECPIVLVPESSGGVLEVQTGDSVDWDSVFVHELAHWRRGDHWAALLGEILVIVFPWNPLSWATRRRIAFLADCACDEQVLRAGGCAARYAESLMAFSTEPLSLALGVASSPSLLFRRIGAILSPECGRRPDRGWSWAALGTATLAVGATFLQPGARQAAIAESPSRPVSQDSARAAIEKREQPVAQNWEERIAALEEGDWRSAFALGGELAALPPNQGVEILTSAWPRLSVEARQQMMKAFRFHGRDRLSELHGRLIDVVHLGMTDSQPKVQEWSINFLREIAFEDFSTDINAYHQWYAANHGRNPRDVMLESCRRYIGELRSGDGRALEKLSNNDFANHVGRHRELQQAANEAGMPDLIERWLKSPPTSEKGRRMLAAMISSVSADEAFLRGVILPAARQNENSDVRGAALRALGKPGNEWALQPLLDTLIQDYKRHGTAGRTVDYFAMGTALGELGDPRAIPTLIGVIQDDNSYETVYGLGYFALSKLTGVRYDESHDGAWWVNWWSANKSRYAPEVAGLAIPKVETSAPKGESITPTETANVAKVESSSPTIECRVKDDENKRYFLIGDIDPRSAPHDGYRLLLVLPGGDGGPEFHDFVKSIQAKALPKGFVVAQLVAPKWSDDENRIVWPTQKTPEKNMKFPTERFIDDVIRDVARQARIDRNHVYALGWSSGGPPVYFAAMQVDSPLAGAFVAMSVFKPDQLPSVEHAKDKAFFILHSPTDFIRMDFPNAAVAQLGAAGAKVKLQTYEGGHGWHGDMFGMIRAGVTWLENPSAAADPAAGSKPANP